MYYVFLNIKNLSLSNYETFDDEYDTKYIRLMQILNCFSGKAKQSAKTEIEKLKLSTLDHKELVKEAARIIYVIHDELKDKQFELEMSWVGKHTNGIQEPVPLDIKNEAESKASQALDEESDSDTEEM